VITALNVTGGTVHVTGSGAQVTTLLATSGTVDASANSLTVTGSATLSQVTVTLTSGTSFTVSGANLVVPTSLNHNVISATGSTLSFAATGVDAAIGIAVPGSNAGPATATFGGSGAWTLSGGLVADVSNVYGADDHAFHYIKIPAGDFDIKAHVATTTNAKAGLLVRNVLGSAPKPNPLPANPLPTAPAGTGNWVGIWNQEAAWAKDGAIPNTPVIAPNPLGISAMPNTPYLEITKAGNIITSYYSTDGTNYTIAHQIDYSTSTSGWGPDTYVGLDLINTGGTAGGGTFNNVNFMGTASLPDLGFTELDLSGGAVVNVSSRIKLGKLTIDSVMQPDGPYTAANTPGSISGSDAIIIGDNSTTLTLGNLSNTYDGSPKAATYTVTPSGLTVNVTYNGSATAPVNAGSYITRAVVSDPYYSGLAAGTLVVSKAPATVTLGNLNQHYDGSTKPVSVTTSPTGLSLTVTYNGLATVPSAMGSYPVVATVSNANYAGTASGTLVIGPVATDFDNWAATYLPIDVSNPAGDYDGDGLTNFQEYAFGLNPTSGTSFNPIVQVADPATGVFQYTRRASPATTGITYTVLTSSNLSAWTPDAGAVPESVTTSGNVETVTFTLSNSPMFGKLFVRVQALQP